MLFLYKVLIFQHPSILSQKKTDGEERQKKRVSFVEFNQVHFYLRQSRRKERVSIPKLIVCNRRSPNTIVCNRWSPKTIFCNRRNPNTIVCYWWSPKTTVCNRQITKTIVCNQWSPKNTVYYRRSPSSCNRQERGSNSQL